MNILKSTTFGEQCYEFTLLFVNAFLAESHLTIRIKKYYAFFTSTILWTCQMRFFHSCFTKVQYTHYGHFINSLYLPRLLHYCFSLFQLNQWNDQKLFGFTWFWRKISGTLTVLFKTETIVMNSTKMAFLASSRCFT